jgi:hypothetical protein
MLIEVLIYLAMGLFGMWNFWFLVVQQKYYKKWLFLFFYLFSFVVIFSRIINLILAARFYLHYNHGGACT